MLLSFLLYAKNIAKVIIIKCSFFKLMCIYTHFIHNTQTHMCTHNTQHPDKDHSQRTGLAFASHSCPEGSTSQADATQGPPGSGSLECPTGATEEHMVVMLTSLKENSHKASGHQH